MHFNGVQLVGGTSMRACVHACVHGCVRVCTCDCVCVFGV